MATIELTFNRDLTGADESVLIGHLQAVRDGLNNSGMLRRIHAPTQLTLDKIAERRYTIYYKMGGYEKITDTKLSPDAFTKALSRMPGYSQVKETVREMEKTFIEFTSKGVTSTVSLPLIILLYECFKQMGFRAQDVVMRVTND